MVNTVYPLRVPALRIDQQVGTFFAVVLPARTLLDVAYSDVVRAEPDPVTGSYVVDGAQRLSDPRRLDAIARYINRVDASFPNSIIISANMHSGSTRIEGDVDIDDEEGADEAGELAEIAKRWRVEEVDRTPNGEAPVSPSYVLTIPTAEKLAAVIDGQHRLFAFAKADPARLDDQLLCSIFIDLPKSMQAQIFATINSNQKAVDKSLTYELFGYNLDDEPQDQWSPEKLAVFLARRIATDPASKMRGRVAVAPVNDFASAATIEKSSMKISFAVIVGGIIRLISSNPKEDANKLKRSRGLKRSDLPKGKPALREPYRDGDDGLIYAATRNFINACDALFWEDAKPNSFIRKTVGVQALFDIYREIAKQMFDAGDMTQDAFIARLKPCASLDFSHQRFQNASGSNRTAIRRIMRVNIGLIPASELPPGDEKFITSEAILYSDRTD